MRRRWLALVMTFGFAMVACKHADDGSQRAFAPPADEPEGPTAADSEPRPTPPHKVLVTPAGGEPVTVHVEVVRDRRSIRRGLMYRQHLPPDHGMLFLMGEERVHTFWMKNTLIPLDMLFIGRDKAVVGVAENTEPLTTEQRFVDTPSFYVLEVNAGWAKRHGVSAGAAVEFVDITE